MIDFGPSLTGPRHYRWPRGRCPRCESRAVTHLVTGMPASFDDVQWVQKWVVSAGCVHSGYDRQCDECGLRWTDGAEEDRERWVELGDKQQE